MSKKVSFPVMSLAFTGILYILGLLVITLRPFVIGAMMTTGSPLSTIALATGFFTFLAAFLLLWALTSFSLHPDIDESNIKLVFVVFTLFILIAFFLATFKLELSLTPSLPL